MNIFAKLFKNFLGYGMDNTCSYSYIHTYAHTCKPDFWLAEGPRYKRMNEKQTGTIHICPYKVENEIHMTDMTDVMLRSTKIDINPWIFENMGKYSKLLCKHVSKKISKNIFVQ